MSEHQQMVLSKQLKFCRPANLETLLTLTAEFTTHGKQEGKTGKSSHERNSECYFYTSGLGLRTRVLVRFQRVAM